MPFLSKNHPLPSELKIEVRQVGNVTILECDGTMTLAGGSSFLRDKVSDEVKAGRRNILLNLAGVRYIDSSGIGELVASSTCTANAGGALKLLNMTKRVQDLLLITKLYTVFEVFDDREAALRSFGPHASAFAPQSDGSTPLPPSA